MMHPTRQTHCAPISSTSDAHSTAKPQDASFSIGFPFFSTGSFRLLLRIPSFCDTSDQLHHHGRCTPKTPLLPT